jgi:hypothetical protein
MVICKVIMTFTCISSFNNKTINNSLECFIVLTSEIISFRFVSFPSLKHEHYNVTGKNQTIIFTFLAADFIQSLEALSHLVGTVIT